MWVMISAARVAWAWLLSVLVLPLVKAAPITTDARLDNFDYNGTFKEKVTAINPVGGGTQRRLQMEEIKNRGPLPLSLSAMTKNRPLWDHFPTCAIRDAET